MNNVFFILLQIKADIETQGEFVNSLIREVNNAVYLDIEDIVAFVKWLDDELCFLVFLSLKLGAFDLNIIRRICT